MKKIAIFVLLGVILLIIFVISSTPDEQSQTETSLETETVSLNDGDVFTLEAGSVTHTIDGKEFEMLAYNGSLPGPTLRVQQGDEITVEFTNHLSEPTTVHWHGVRVENQYDGVPDVTQAPVEPNNSFTYKLRFPDAGVYWYHPHIREDKQQELGLYGNIIVEPEDSTYYPAADAEQLLMIDDIKLSGSIIYPFQSDLIDHALMGRFGNTMLVNGSDDYKLDVKAGTVTRLYFTNTANTRTFNISIPGAEMKRVGGDSGRYSFDELVDSVILAPGERTIIDVLIEESGTYPLLNTTPDNTYTLGEILATDGDATAASLAFGTLESSTLETAEIEKFRPHFDKEPDLEWRLDVETSMHHGMMHGGESDEAPFAGIEWEDSMGMMNAHMSNLSTFWKIVDMKTGKENMEAMTEWKQGDVIKIRIFNDPNSDHPMQHPIHIHGQRFLVLSEENLVWKDTVIVRSGATVDILVDLSNPGEWMAHCHIAEHLHSGMMTSLMIKAS